MTQTAAAFARDPHSALQRRAAVEVSHRSQTNFHMPAPSLPTQHGARDVIHSIGEKLRKSGRSHCERTETRTSLHARLVENVTEPSKVVAQKVKASPDSVDSYRQVNVPKSWAQMIEFGRAYPGFALDVMELMGIDIDRDRDAYAMFLSLQRQVRGE